MARLDELTDTLALNPEAPFPPFPVYLSVPATWTVLDTNPATWERSAERMIDTTFQGSKVTGRERRQIVSFFGEVVAHCQQAGTALSLLQVGRLREGVAASLGIHLAFVDEQSPSSIGRIRDSLPRTGTTTEIATAVGEALQRSERTTFLPPGATELVAMTSIQVFVPLPDSNWTLVLATSCAHPELTEALTLLMQRIAASVRLTEDGSDPDGTDGAGAEDDDQPAEFEETSTVRGPGIERGFRTLVRKQLAAPEGSAPDDGDDADDAAGTGGDGR